MTVPLACISMAFLFLVGVITLTAFSCMVVVASVLMVTNILTEIHNSMFTDFILFENNC